MFPELFLSESYLNKLVDFLDDAVFKLFSSFIFPFDLKFSSILFRRLESVLIYDIASQYSHLRVLKALSNLLFS